MSREDEGPPIAQLLAHAREEVTRSDTKASIVLASAGVGMGAFLGGAVSGSWSPNDLNNKVEWLWWLGACAFAFGALAVSKSIWPSTKISDLPKSGPSYFADFAKYTSSTELIASIEPDVLTHQLLAVSRIAVQKYQHLKIGLASIVGGSISMACAAGISVFFL